MQIVPSTAQSIAHGIAVNGVSACLIHGLRNKRSTRHRKQVRQRLLLDQFAAGEGFDDPVLISVHVLLCCFAIRLELAHWFMCCENGDDDGISNRYRKR